MLRCPYCEQSTVRRSHRAGAWEMVYYRITWLRPYRCETCRNRFAARKENWRILRWETTAGLLLALCILPPAGFIIALDYRGAISSALRVRTQGEETEYNRRRFETTGDAEKRRMLDRAKAQVIRAIALHRGGREGLDVIAMVTNPDDPIYRLVRDVFRRAGVPDQLVAESLADWTKGVNVLEIGRRWHEKGIDIPAVIKDAEGQGLPVSKFLREKDTLR